MLINLWKKIQASPLEVSQTYRLLWKTFQKTPDRYYRIRAAFNRTHNPLLLLFLSRTCYGGVIRFNRAGEFNSPINRLQPGVHPDKMHELLVAWAEKLASVEFFCRDYRENVLLPDDLLFCDPPYSAPTSKSLYNGNAFDYTAFFEWIAVQPCKWLFTLNASQEVPPIFVRAVPLHTNRSLLYSAGKQQVAYMNY